MSVNITITNAGLAALINAAGTGTSAVNIAVVGLSSTAITPDPTLTSLAGEFKRVTTLSGNQVSPDTIHLIMQDASADAYPLNAFALYLADGTLFAIYGQPAPIYTKTAVSVGMLAIDITFASPLASAITFGNTNFINPPATQTTMGVVQLASQATADAGIDNAQALTAQTAANALLSWLGYAPVNRAGDEMTGMLTLAGTDLARGISMPGTDGRDLRVVHKDNGVFGFTDETAHIELLTIHPNNAIMALQQFLMWHAGNDGAGSGLDADMVDGHHAGDFLPATAITSGATANGWWEKRVCADGTVIIEQQGRVSTAMGEGAVTITFPIPFGNADSVFVEAMAANPGASNGINGWFQNVSNDTLTATLYLQYSGDAGAISGFSWRAKGFG